jgi:two-component system sensor histidine kinase KdpD
VRRRIVLNASIDVSIFILAIAGTYTAQLGDRPITAVLVFLSGVIAIAFRSGLINGVVAAFAASVIYNFFLSEPTFRFGITTADEAMPLLAFNVAALLAAAMVGRLKDSAQKAYIAQSETAFLLTVSDRLQSAVKVDEVEAAIRGIVPHEGVSAVEIFLSRGNVYYRPSTGEVDIDRLQTLLETATDIWPAGSGKSVIVELNGARGSMGIAKFKLAGDALDRADQKNLQSIASMLALAVERCLLLEEVMEARALARTEALKDALLSSVSHDLRTPLTVIKAAAGALNSSEVDLPEKERERLLSSILEHCGRLDRYTAELLDVGMIQSGIQANALEVVDPAEIVQLAINQAKSVYPGIKIQRDISREQHFIRANPGMLQQAIYNVIDNAQKFGGEAGPVEVALGFADEEAMITVADRGPGIFEQERASVFTRFYKGSGNTNKAGLGLGLFIAKGFVEAFSGTITVESPVANGRGSRFQLRLPLIAAQDQAASA